MKNTKMTDALIATAAKPLLWMAVALGGALPVFGSDASSIERVVPTDANAAESVSVGAGPQLDKVYWGTGSTGTVRRANTDGTGAELLVTLPSSLEV